MPPIRNILFGDVNYSHKAILELFGIAVKLEYIVSSGRIYVLFRLCRVLAKRDTSSPPATSVALATIAQGNRAGNRGKSGQKRTEAVKSERSKSVHLGRPPRRQHGTWNVYNANNQTSGMWGPASPDHLQISACACLEKRL